VNVRLGFVSLVALLLVEAAPAIGAPTFTALASVNGLGNSNTGPVPTRVEKSGLGIAGQEAHAWAESGVGILRAFAQTNGNGYADASAGFTDIVTITTPGHSAGIGRASISLSGTSAYSSFSAPPDDQQWLQSSSVLMGVAIGLSDVNRPFELLFAAQAESSATFERSYNYDFETDSYVLYEFNNLPGTTSIAASRNGEDFTPTTFAGTYEFDIPFTSGVPFNFRMNSLCIASVRGFPQQSAAPATCDFGATAVWNGISGVRNSAGSPINFTATSATGLNFAEGYTAANPVPEPASWVMLLVGFAGIGAALRNSRRDRVALSSR
jgi:hypothetical protein